MANEGDLKCVFQFDSEGMRKLVKEGGVDRFEDLVAYTALYRPGPLNCLQKDSKVYLKNGFKSIKDLQPGFDEILYLGGNSNISSTKKYFVIKTGFKKLLKIKTKTGKIILCSPDHPILTQKNKFEKSQDLKVGDKIATLKQK
jgi:intein/homing endonuclease